MNKVKTIEDNLEILGPFVLDIKKYLTETRNRSLFKKLPISDLTENTNKKLADGSYLFSPCGVELNKSECNLLALQLMDILKLHLVDRKNEIDIINNLLLNEKIIPEQIILDTIKNDGNEIKKLIRELNIPEDLFTFYLIYLTRPFREQAAEHLVGKIEKMIWLYGYCPVCGHWPSLSHISSESGARTLWCLCCNSKWNFKRTQCVFCLNENQEQLEIINPIDEDKYRIQTCKKCKRYLKEVRSSLEINEFPFDKMYLGTLPLDVIAESEGYIQESILTVRYNNDDGNELLMYRQKAIKQKIIYN